MAGKDPLLDAISKFKKSAPDAVKKNKKLLTEMAGLEKALKAKDATYRKKIASFVKALGASKKDVKKDRVAVKFVEEIEKIAKRDQSDRLKLAREKSTRPS